MTNIAWTDESWNPVTGCTKVSQACKNCYAETIARRFWGDRKFNDVRCHPDRLAAPLRWRKPRLVFVNSMSDLFHEDVPGEFIDRVFRTICQCAGRHTFQILTKRPRRMLEWFERAKRVNSGWFNPHTGQFDLWQTWFGVSVEDQATADERIPLLLQTPAAVRFVSCEPLLGPIDFDSTCEGDPCPSSYLTGIDGDRVYDGQKCALDWLIVGGESGPGHRTMNLDHLKSIVEQCQRAEVPVFVKQDKGPKPGQQGRIPDDVWALKQFPRS